MKINFLPWHKEVISLWEKLVNENGVLQATLFAYQTNGLVAFISINKKTGEVDPYILDEKFFGIFASESQKERSAESVTRILEDVIYFISKKIIFNIENDTKVEMVSNIFQIIYYPLTKGVYIVPNERKFVNFKKYTPEIISEIQNIISIFEKNLITA